MNLCVIALILATLLSCSSIKKQRTIGAIVGSVALGGIGASIGHELSPNPESDRLNQSYGLLIGGITGLYLGAKTGEHLWQDKPSNRTHKTLLTPESTQMPASTIRVIRPKNLKRIKLDTKLPEFLKGKVKEANVITYELESYEEVTEDGRRIIHEPHKAYEYVLE